MIKKLIIVCFIILAFLTGFISSYAINYVYIDNESPFLVSFGNNTEQPSNWIKEDQIKLFDDRVVIYVDNPQLSRYAPTGSMLPTLGELGNGIKIVPESPEQIDIGDIISYDSEDKIVVHRVIDKGEDAEGIYFVTKGDNNNETDGKVYWEDIKYVTIALVY